MIQRSNSIGGDTLFITIDLDSDEPLFQQIHDRIIDGITSGQITNGQKLDSVRRVAAEFGINPATVQKAYDLLKSDGIIATEKRSGSVVRIAREATDQQRSQLQRELTRILSRARIQGVAESEIERQVAEILTSIAQPTSRFTPPRIPEQDG